MLISYVHCLNNTIHQYMLIEMLYILTKNSLWIRKNFVCLSWSNVTFRKSLETSINMQNAYFLINTGRETKCWKCVKYTKCFVIDFKNKLIKLSSCAAGPFYLKKILPLEHVLPLGYLQISGVKLVRTMTALYFLCYLIRIWTDLFWNSSLPGHSLLVLSFAKSLVCFRHSFFHLLCLLCL